MCSRSSSCSFSVRSTPWPKNSLHSRYFEEAAEQLSSTLFHNCRGNILSSRMLLKSMPSLTVVFQLFSKRHVFVFFLLDFLNNFFAKSALFVSLARSFSNFLFLWHLYFWRIISLFESTSLFFRMFYGSALSNAREKMKRIESVFRWWAQFWKKGY